ncbi:ADP-ribosylglycohydrolase family protein [Sediminispirochaeta smaragdinae]|uniref:ADP-ribosylation/Crystallin J1 n=1 Tax=Sediminispirochaeta smaragdinae (strain DSM 11293 / JCM 15392 / SEBR 4228) TaxID=573413 RepID=E1R3T8_SEDSS|nr:ADP-ribosylglycohydrolase family protein [Sediminispirochaeta smaragdinae]ADK82059.1 ADP-ribosylation/Crystallin J1 [Sediminispirochaeta smaragdinae DSM 11293]
MKHDTRKGIIYGALAADSLSLGSHWIYNVDAIAKRIGRPRDLSDPLVKTFHPNRKRGEFTHYGDQTLWLLESIADKGGYDQEAFFQLWKEKMAIYDGYMDHASKDTLSGGKASSMDDLGGAGRTAALALLFTDPAALADAAASQASLTHDHPLVRDVARFFSRLLFHGDQPMEDAIISVLEEQVWESGDLLPSLVKAGMETAGEETIAVIGRFGQMCSAERALPGTIHLLVSYPDDYEEAMISNVAAGGDSAARGLLAGMILGARSGFSSIPVRWTGALAAADRIDDAVDRIASL